MKKLLSVVILLALTPAAYAEYGRGVYFSYGAPVYRAPSVTTYGSPLYYGRYRPYFRVVDGSSIPAFTTGGFATGGLVGFAPTGAYPVSSAYAARQDLHRAAAARRAALRPIRTAEYAKARVAELAKRAERRKAIVAKLERLKTERAEADSGAGL